MKLLVVNFEYPPLGGGGGVATRYLVRELAKRGHEVHVLTTGRKGLPAEENDDGVFVHRVKVIGRTRLEAATMVSLASFLPVALWKGWTVGRKIEFEVINAQFVIPSGIVGVVLAKLWHVPLVVSLIGGDVYDPSKALSPHRHWWLRLMVRGVCGRAQALTAISEDTADRARRLHGVRGKIEVVPIGVPRTGGVRDRRPGSGQLKAVTIGRLIPRKKFDVLMEAWKGLEDMQLTVIGSGPEEESLKKKAWAWGVGSRVKWAGYVEEGEKQRLLSEADIYVSAASHEGFGIVFLEAMAAGLPVVATDVGGQRDFLAEGVNALLVPVEDPAALAAAVRRLASDPELRQRMGACNASKVQEYFWDKLAVRFEEVLMEAARIKV